ncbi:MAG: M48 family metalloprotease [Candidatus Adiutrix sp.]|jgi:predicted Zn-dependent protease|nr:M48 family metalloprotease [Candidatus Adiutrix sp.]
MKKLYFPLAGLFLFMSGCTMATLADTVGSMIPVRSPVPVSQLVSTGQKIFKSFEDFTPEEEHYLGRAVAATILAKYQPLRDNHSDRYLNLLGQSLARHSAKPDVLGGYHFIVLNSDEVNAFAAPGGLIMVTRGMVRTAANEDELAAVLAHEIAHVELSHGISSIKSARRDDALLTVGSLAASQALAKSNLSAQMTALGNLLGAAAKDIAQDLMTNGYSRSAELEADQAALAILTNAGYAPSALDSVLGHMEPRIQSGIGFGKTHPSPADRRQSLGLSNGPVPANPVRQARFTAALSALR